MDDRLTHFLNLIRISTASSLAFFMMAASSIVRSLPSSIAIRPSIMTVCTSPPRTAYTKGSPRPARQAARFFVLLDRGLLVSPERSLEMKRILSRPGISHKFVKGLEGFPDVRIYRESGTYQIWHADAALVEHGSRRYVAAALVEDGDGGRLLERLILELDAAVTPSRPAGPDNRGFRTSPPRARPPSTASPPSSRPRVVSALPWLLRR